MSRLKRGTAVAAAAAVALAVSVGVADRFGSDDARANGSTVTGRAFVDFNSNGIKNAGDNFAEATDSPAPGVEVKAYDSVGKLVGTATSGADGSYTLTVAGAASDQLRIEFSTPSGYEPSFVSTGSTSENNSSVQFVTTGATGVDYAVTNPDDYCQSNPEMVTCVYPTNSWGPPATDDPGALIFPSTMTRLQTNSGTSSGPGWPADSPTSPTYSSYPRNVVAGQSELGSVFGMGIDRERNVFFGTYVKRHVPYGPGGATNTIYRRNLDSGSSSDVDSFITLPGTLPDHSAQNPVGVGPGFPPYAADGRRNVSPGQQGYSDVYSKVGRVGLGDVDVSPDGKTLYAVDMNESAPRLYSVPLSGEGSVVTHGDPTAISIPRPTPYDGSTCEGTWHPMGLGIRNGNIYVGGTCGAENTVGGTYSSMPAGCFPATIDLASCDVNTSPYGKLVDGRTVARGYVLKYSGGSWQTVASIALDQKRTVAGSLNASRYTPVNVYSGVWRAWSEAVYWTDGYQEEALSGPQPMISNIEVTDNGSLVVGMRDRWQDMRGDSGTISYEALTDTVTSTPVSGGDLIRLCPGSSGRFDVESGGACGADQGAPVPQITSAGLGYGGSTFYFNAFGVVYGAGSVVHPYTGLGATASMPGSTAVWSTAYDVSSYTQQGVRAYGYCAPGSTDCAPDNGGIGSQIAAIDWDGGLGWGKGNGLADLELLCNKAPVQVGNRLWIDADKNGIQDPGEKTLAGVTVRLYDSSGALVGTAVTDSEGRYYFSSTLDKPSSGDGTSQGGGLKANAAFKLRIDNADDYKSGGPLYGYSLTVRDAGTDNAINSKAVASGSGAFGSGSFPEITVAARKPGENNHTFDAGFIGGPDPGPSPGSVTAPEISVAAGACVDWGETKTVAVSVRNRNSAALTSRRVEAVIPKGFKVVGGTRGYFVRKGVVTWKNGTIAAGKTERLKLKLTATKRSKARSRIQLRASGKVGTTSTSGRGRGWLSVCHKSKPRFTG